MSRRFRGEAPRQVDQPQAGQYAMRLVRGGVEVGAEIVLHPDGRWQAIIDGTPQEPAHTDPAQAAGVFRIWHGARRIPSHEHAYLLARGQWARSHAPDHPAADPTQRVRLSDLPPVF